MTELISISGNNKPQHKKADLIFVHGLDGNAWSTWMQKDRQGTFWPSWLGQDFPEIGVWTLGYDSSSSAWSGDTMPLKERANNVLNLFVQYDIGKLPIGFVCHSLGGLLVKRLLYNASLSLNEDWKKITKQTRYIVFLSTPHSGSSIANWLQYLELLRPTVSVKELKTLHPQLLELNTWYRDRVSDPSASRKLNIKNFVFCEEQKTGRFIFNIGGFLVVDKYSADPGIPGVTPIVLDENHISICKPASKEHQVYRQVQQMTEDLIAVEAGNAEIIDGREPPGINEKTDPSSNIPPTGDNSLNPAIDLKTSENPIIAPFTLPSDNSLQKTTRQLSSFYKFDLQDNSAPRRGYNEETKSNPEIPVPRKSLEDIQAHQRNLDSYLNKYITFSELLVSYTKIVERIENSRQKFSADEILKEGYWKDIQKLLEDTTPDDFDRISISEGGKNHAELAKSALSKAQTLVNKALDYVKDADVKNIKNEVLDNVSKEMQNMVTALESLAKRCQEQAKNELQQVSNSVNWILDYVNTQLKSFDPSERTLAGKPLLTQSTNDNDEKTERIRKSI